MQDLGRGVLEEFAAFGVGLPALPVEEPHKMCATCGDGLPLSAFYKRSMGCKDNPGGPYSECKGCHVARMRIVHAERAAEDPDFFARHRTQMTKGAEKAARKKHRSGGLAWLPARTT